VKGEVDSEYNNFEELNRKKEAAAF
jgi:hypothetical protein